MKRMSIKTIARNGLTNILGWQARRLCNRHDFLIVAVAGSVGKTSTKCAIAQLLGSKLRVRFQEGNYNVALTVPLVLFGLSKPSLLNPFAWISTLIKIEAMIHKPYPFDVVVLELGTDGPGQLKSFQKWLRADIGILTAIAPEHMEFFSTIDAVAREELVIGDLAQTVLFNRDLLPPEYMPDWKHGLDYGIHETSSYRVKDVHFGDQGCTFSIVTGDGKRIRTAHPSVSEVQLYSICAACAVADVLGFSEEEITDGVAAILPVSGRMQILRGIHDTTIIDDTYNASPEAYKAALTVLYDMPGTQKIALVGSMNELGTHSAAAHKEIGLFCDPKRLDLVVTLGHDANQFLADAAERQGCSVVRTTTPYDAARIILNMLQEGAVILAKGSQNKVYAEEAVKLLLADPLDASKLVRQGRDWQRVKQKNFQKQRAV